MKLFHDPRSLRRTAGQAGLMIVGTFAFCGCQPTSSGQGGSVRAASPPPSAAAVDTGAQAQSEITVRKFVAALTGGKAAQAASFLDASLRTKTPSAKIASLIQSEWRPFVGSGPMQFDSPQTISHGTKTLLRTRFTGANGRDYRANFVLVGEKKQWYIQLVFPPSTESQPAGTRGGSAAG